VADGRAISDGELCNLPSDSGSCDMYVPAYFYDRLSRRCEQFVWSGCGGNANRFTSLSDCEQRCIYLEASVAPTTQSTTTFSTGKTETSSRSILP